MIKSDNDYQWELFGQKDPHYGVFTSDKFRKGNIDDNIEQFYESGRSYIDFIIKNIREHLDNNFQPDRCLDFGCGVGRLTIPLSAICNYVLGVDVSKSMLQEAKSNCDKRGLLNVEFIKSDDQLSNILGNYNFINSFIVFQHIPVKRGETIFANLIERLDENGVGVIHFTYYYTQRIKNMIHCVGRNIPYFYNLINIIKGRNFSDPYLHMFDYKMNNIFKILEKSGCNHTYMRCTDHSGHKGVILFFQKKRMEIW